MEHEPAGPAPDLAPDVISTHPLAYLLGLQGVALFRAFNGEFDRAYAEARIAEVRALLAQADVIGAGVDVPVIPTAEAYDGWAPVYDVPRNLMLEREQVLVHAILDELAAGTALDVACGTGRHMAHLAGRGHTVIGTDVSPGMLAVAREKLPDAELHLADMHALPVADASIDTVVTGLALNHVPDLAPVFAEFARVLRPGGHLVVSDSRGLFDGARLYPMVFADRDGNPGFMRSWVHATSAYLHAALPLGLEVLSCQEIGGDVDMVDATGTELIDDEPAERWTSRPESPSIWALHPWAPAGTNANFRGKASCIVWHFRLAA